MATCYGVSSKYRCIPGRVVTLCLWFAIFIQFARSHGVGFDDVFITSSSYYFALPLSNEALWSYSHVYHIISHIGGRDMVGLVVRQREGHHSLNG